MSWNIHKKKKKKKKHVHVPKSKKNFLKKKKLKIEIGAVPSRQAIEVRVELVSEVRIRESVFVTSLDQAIEDIVPHIEVVETPEAPRRRRALSHAFGQIHQRLFFLFFFLSSFPWRKWQRNPARQREKERENLLSAWGEREGYVWVDCCGIWILRRMRAVCYFRRKWRAFSSKHFANKGAHECTLVFACQKRMHTRFLFLLEKLYEMHLSLGKIFKCLFSF